MVPTSTKYILKPDKSIWTVIPNPDPSNITGCGKCGCPITYAVRHRDGGFIRFYQGRTMNKQTAIKLAHQLNQE